ncbi:hypothetical protein SCLCIDRAFT_377451 [Scleroderma citrinum Foug A]|uniref:C3H1-type domain-containing protein n=1 Tax=Scleroderma citrinum Foug A TaxID=1036808 RepID=A0A0C3D0X4_9AGAM|nr:hypothetical protein SCLCIDRAFT_377451 [Scleroderma citrinum Foug A]
MQQPNPHIPDSSNSNGHPLDKSSGPKRDDDKPENFYPITWRVIGGGVRMSGERKICDAFAAGYCKYGDDCKFAHETDIEMDRYGYLKLTSGAAVPANRNGVRTSGASERFSGSTQERVQTPDRIISRPKTARARPTPPELSSTELLDVESREKRTTLHVPRDVIEDACCSKGDDDTNGGLRHPTSPCLPHRRTRSMVGLVSPLSVVPATTPVNFSAEF